MDQSATDAEVMARSLEDPTAFATIFDRHHEAIHRFLWTRAGEAHADDLAAEAFRIAFERREDYDLDHSSAKPWLFGIASNLAKQHHRRAAKGDEVRQRAAAGGSEAVQGPQRRLERLAPSTPVARALLDLPERDREPLLLFAWADLTYAEIAAALDIPVGTVRSRIHRAREQTRERLEEAAPDLTGQRGDGHD